MSLRIAFDMDGVLADMDAALVCHAESVFGEAITRQLQQPTETAETAGGSVGAATVDDAASDPPEEATDASPPLTADGSPPVARLNMTSRQQRKLWRHISSVENFWETLDETESGVISRLASLAAERRWEVIFLTKRPKTRGGTAQLQSQRWLTSKGFPLPSVYVVQGSRGRIAAALDLDVVVDDRPENCLDVVVDSKARAILVWREDEKTLPTAARRLGIGVVRSVSDCLDILTSLDRHDPQQDPGLLARVRKMLGLKEAAGA
jgi:hypothetical protein